MTSRPSWKSLMSGPEVTSPSELDRLAGQAGVVWAALVAPTGIFQKPEAGAEPVPKQLYPALLDLWETYAAVNRTPTALHLRFEQDDLLILLGGALFLVLKLTPEANLTRITRQARASLLRQQL